VIAGIARLKQHGWTVIIVTNGPPEQIRKIEACGLSAAVDGWCISEIVGSAKPDRRIFDAAAELAQLPLRGWMVGDTSSADVVGGRAVGLRTIWLARGRAEPEPAALRADLTVETVFDAFEAILHSRADDHT
jgi:FMN phosphatase YigB (HAD superfamily)